MLSQSLLLSTKRWGRSAVLGFITFLQEMAGDSQSRPSFHYQERNRYRKAETASLERVWEPLLSGITRYITRLS